MMSQVYIGTFDAGAAEVKFDSKRITFMLGKPTPGSNSYVYAHLAVTALKRFEVDKDRGTLCMWGMWDLHFADELNGAYMPFLSHMDAEASIFMQFNKADFPRSSWPSDILKVHPKFAQLIHFTSGHMGRPLAAHAPTAAKKPAPKPKAPSSQGGRQQKAAVSGGAGSSSGDMQQTLTGGRYTPLALQPSGDSNRVVLVYPDEQAKDAVTLTDEELQRLVENEYLNDTLVDYKLKQIQASLSPALLERCHFFNSFFFKRLMQSIGGNKRLKDPAAIAEGYKAVQRWTKSVDLFAKDFVFVPINDGEASVEEEAASAQGAVGGVTAPQFDDDDAVVNPPSTDVTTTRRADQLSPAALLPAAARPGREPCIMYLDSMGGSKQKAFHLLKIYLDLERKDKEAKGTAGKPLKVEGAGSVDLTAEVHEYRGEFDKMPEYDIEVPHQNNSVDCGLYMLQFVSRVAHEQPDLAGARKRRWEEAECQGGGKLGLKDLSPHDITEMRSDMYMTIKALGEEQQAKKKVKAEGKAEGAPSVAAGVADGKRKRSKKINDEDDDEC
ncbi:sentrin-specific protease 7 [Chrysochromulina tobinii]|uniref:Sentrin-specific protease 7 n=1 Tax=Chrysochromulina tobinii TaxID=1460289 RepID=A0A0M0JGI5_9EUKA|nr:sentrin-specific protease 7 [Chrysochromulina tobinii]|eukprot:KOO25560.1 sentrin-specific protease 7 [Chrysochromulina sp. CCMP291]